MKIIPDSTNGVIKTILGTQTEFDLTGLSLPTNNYKINRIAFCTYHYTSSYNHVFLYVDDIYLLDSTAPNNDLMGVCSVYGSLPNANGDYTDMTPYGAAQLWDCIDEASTDGGQYVYGDAVDRKFTANLSNISTTGEIKGIRHQE